MDTKTLRAFWQIIIEEYYAKEFVSREEAEAMVDEIDIYPIDTTKCITYSHEGETTVLWSASGTAIVRAIERTGQVIKS